MFFIYHWIYNKLRSLYSYIYANFLLKNHKKVVDEQYVKKKIITEAEFIENEKTKFNDIYKKPQKLEKANLNMDVLFYKIQKYNEEMLNVKNTLEPKWRSRVLFINTPRGNIITYYDCYKRGFSYFSDQTNIPYSLLNAIAMRYVIHFRCLDLFIDNKLFQNEYNESPLIGLKDIEDKKEREKDVQKYLKNNISLDFIKKAPMVKLKKYNISTSLDKTREQSNILKPLKPKLNKDELYSINRFIYMGKIQNFSFLQKEAYTMKKNIENIEKISFSYKDFLMKSKKG